MYSPASFRVYLDILLGGVRSVIRFNFAFAFAFDSAFALASAFSFRQCYVQSRDMSVAAVAGAGIVVTTTRHGTVAALIGKESIHLVDIFPHGSAERAYIRSLERFAGSYADSRAHFEANAKELSRRHGRRVQFSQLTGSDTTGWRTIYHVLPSPSKIVTGIPKGHADPGETSLKTARREFTEEIGFSLKDIPDTEFVELGKIDGYPMFHLNVSNAIRSEIETAIAKNEKDHYSELFDCRFVVLGRALETPLNKKSRSALSATAAASRFSGGSRRKIAVKSIRMAGDIPAVGTKAQVFHGTAKHTAGGLTKSDLVQNKHGRIVSRRKMMAGKKALKYLTRKGYKARKGTFKLFRKHRSTSRQQGGFF